MQRPRYRCSRQNTWVTATTVVRRCGNLRVVAWLSCCLRGHSIVTIVLFSRGLSRYLFRITSLWQRLHVWYFNLPIEWRWWQFFRVAPTAVPSWRLTGNHKQMAGRVCKVDPVMMACLHCGIGYKSFKTWDQRTEYAFECNLCDKYSQRNENVILHGPSWPQVQNGVADLQLIK